MITAVLRAATAPASAAGSLLTQTANAFVAGLATSHSSLQLAAAERTYAAFSLASLTGPTPVPAQRVA